MDVTIVIPTYNGAERVPTVLEQLRKQIVPANIQWEILVVDNNSQDDLAAVISQQQQTWPEAVPLRSVFEGRQGIAFARQRGVENARGKVVGFLDDDNLPDTDWVAAIYEFAAAHPQAGAIGSQICGKFESPPDPALKPILFYLAINQRGQSPFKYVPAQKGVPPGAGLVVNRAAWLAHVPSSLLLVGRVNQSMLAGEDAEALLHLYRAGWEIWYNPKMKIDHCIANNRLQYTYLRRNLLGIGLSRYYLRMLQLAPWRRPPMTVVYLLSDGLKLLRHLLQHGRTVQQEGIANCEWALLWGTWISPLYLFKVWWQKGQASNGAK